MRFLKDVVKKTGVINLYRRSTAQLMLYPTYSPEVQKLTSCKPDYFRYATYALAIQRIIDEKIEGSFAETGVYQGNMSSFINLLVPSRKFYLFDTFNGFPKNDLEKGDDRFKDTSVETVLAKISSPDNVVVKKGNVPDTFAGLENEKFAFVLIDLDLYKPTKAALNFFYSRMNPQGYIIVHDYNNPESDWACKRAVNEFFSDKLEKPVEIADNWGSVIIRKI